MPRKKFRTHVIEELQRKGVWTEELYDEVPHKWERHGDLAIVGPQYIKNKVWRELSVSSWTLISKRMGATRVAQRMGPILNDDFRTPNIEFVHNPGSSTQATKLEDGINYTWDVTKCMFSSGNLSEKQRIARFDCKGKVVVDMFAGIGYFTLPYLVHAKADLVIAIEWNPDAVEALKKNLELNKVENRCRVIVGDNTEVFPGNVADHVNLGLIPSSEKSWLAACCALRRTTGGILHIHGNVDCPNSDNLKRDNEAAAVVDDAVDRWVAATLKRISNIFESLYAETWVVNKTFVGRVKSYGPCVDHMVLDIECRPSAD